MREDYNAVIRVCSKELSARERVLIKDTTNAISLDEATSDSDSPLVISPDFYAVLDVHNEKSDNKDYTKYILVDKNGNKFVTGSDSFWNSFMEIMAEMEGEGDFEIQVYRRESKNYKGKSFITCSIV